MRWVDRHALLALTLPCLLGAAAASAAEKSTYGKVDTFEPGKKYSCVPTPDRKGWDCTQTGKAADKAPPEPAPPPATSSTPAPAAVSAAPAAAASPPPTVAAPPAPSEPAPSTAPQAAHSSELPGYLSARAASGGSAPQQPAVPPPAPVHNAAVSTNSPAPAPTAPETLRPSTAAAHEPAAAPPPAAPTAAQVTNASAETPAQRAPAPAAPAPAKSAEVPAAQRTQTAQTAAPPAAPAAPSPPPPAAPATAAVVPPRAIAASGGANARRDGEAFLALDADQYVIELGHAASAAELDALDVRPPRGEVYKLHLRQNGTDNWLLVWGSFDDVSAARAARAEFAAAAAVTPGWPRRVAPLQAEVRRTRD